ncbi:MAG: (Fe-S)-binding protein [Phycisphaerales bacterium]|jgi:L-lactate dehydrogenase complex protein LldE|nr:(Fe-S)-binding protein [Phycisphaerales bacterium]
MSRKVALFATCLGDQLWPEVVQATADVLQRAGCVVTFDPAQTCCAQPAFNSGYQQEAKAVARRFVEIFERADAIVAPSGSCTAMVHRYPHLFRDEPAWRARAEAVAHKAFEFSSFLVRELGVTDVGATLRARVAWHDACHGLRELGVHDEPRALLAAVRGLELVDLRTGEACCGFGGTFAVKFPELSTAMLDHKLSALDERVDVLSAIDSSCLMQIRGRLQRRGSRVRALHLAEILAST